MSDFGILVCLKKDKLLVGKSISYCGAPFVVSFFSTFNFVV